MNEDQAGLKAVRQNAAQDADYITDVEYTGGVFAHQAPALMNYIAAINGGAYPSLKEEFAYCELGCGKGITSLALAALHPNSRFFACDMNPGHIRFARELARKSDIGNVTFLERTFAGMLDERLPVFDFITLHGVWGWVSEAVRSEIKSFLKARLKPGGLAMISYNAMPGWAHIHPIRRMMRAYADALSGDSIEKARQAIAYVRYLSDNRAEYFVANPAAAEHLAAVEGADIRYVAHEYMTPYSDPFYFADVANSLRQIGLEFVGSMTPECNYHSVMMPEQFQRLASTAPSRMVLETHRDFIVNTRFRNDLYMAPTSVSEPSSNNFSGLGNAIFRIASVAERLSLKGDRGGLRFDFEPHAGKAAAIFACLAKKPASANELHRVVGLKSEVETFQLIQDLVVARHLWPCAPVAVPCDPGKLNSALIELALQDRQGKVALVCPRTGTTEQFDLGFAMAIESLKEMTDALDAAKAILARLRKHGLSTKRHGSGEAAAVMNEAEELQHHTSICRALRDAKHADFRLLSILGLNGQGADCKGMP